MKNDSFSMIGPLPDDPVTTMAYVPYQTDTEMYSDEQALCSGTLYKNLDKPFKRGALK